MDQQTIIMIAVLVGLLLIGAMLFAAYFIRRSVSASIESFSWFRKIFFEHYVWVEDSSYHGFPDGSRNQHKKRESYQVQELVRTETTTTTTGNGQTSTTSRPVYESVTRWRTKYIYEIQKWVRSRELVAEGSERATLHWPTYRLDHSTQEQIEGTTEKYLVTFRSAKDKKYTRRLAEADWTALDEQATYTLKVNLFGQVKRVGVGPEQLIEMPEQTC